MLPQNAEKQYQPVLPNSCPLKKQFVEKQKTDSFFQICFLSPFGFSVHVEMRGLSPKAKVIQLNNLENTIWNCTFSNWVRSGSDVAYRRVVQCNGGAWDPGRNGLLL